MSRSARVALLVLVAGACSRAPSGFRPPTDEVRLDIPDRPWAPEAPPEGWCGEASIQMAAIHFGAWIPQRLINEAGRPQTPDLWEQDLPTALAALGLEHEEWTRPGQLESFLDWVVASIRAGRPVIVGVKIYPSLHPDWAVDHLVLAVGFSPAGLVLNTNMGEQQATYPWRRLLAKGEGYSLVGPGQRAYGYAVRGFRGTGPSVRVRVVEEAAGDLRLGLLVRGLEAGRRYALLREDLRGGRTTTPFVADAAERLLTELAFADRAARFTVVEAGSEARLEHQ